MKNYKIIMLILAVFLIAIFLFLTKLPFTFIADDSPETITCFQQLLIQHPPGYPLNTMTGKIFTLIPLCNPMMKANFASAFFHILSSLVLFLIVLKILKNEKEKFLASATAAFAVIFYLFSNTAFLQAMSAKGSIYTLHSFLTALIFCFLLNLNKGNKYFYLISFLFALALTNHWPSTVVMIPGIAVYIFFSKFRFNIKIIIYSFMLFVIGLTPFLFLFIRSATNPDMLWPVKDFRDFIWLLSRQQYSGVDAHHTIKDTIIFLKYLFKNILPEQYPFLLFFLVLPGIVFIFRYDRKFCVSSFVVILSMLAGIASVNIMKEKMEWVVKPYLVFIYLFFSVYIAFVFFKLSGFIKNTKAFRIIFALLLGFVLFLLYRNCPDYSKYYLAYDYVQNIFRTLPDDSVYLAEGDLNVAGSIYATNIEKKKVVLVISSLLSHRWYRDLLKKKYRIKTEDDFTGYKNSIRNIVQLNQGRKFYYSNTYTKNWIDFSLFQRGVVYEISTDFNKKDKRNNYYMDFMEYAYRGALDRIPYDDSTKTFVFKNFGLTWFFAGKIFEERNEKMNTLYYFTRAFNFYKDDVIAYKIGLHYYDIEKMEKSIYYLQEAVKINRKNIPAYRMLIAHGVIANDYKMMRKYAKEILKYDKKNIDAINLLKEIGE